MNIKEKGLHPGCSSSLGLKQKKRRWTPLSGNSLFTVVLVDIINVGHFPIYKNERKKIYLDIYISCKWWGGRKVWGPLKALEKDVLLCFLFIIVISIGPFSSSPIINKVYSGPFSFIYFSVCVSYVAFRVT